MVFKKLLSSLGFGGVEVDTVLSAPAVTAGGPLTGQVHLRAKGDVDISSIQLLLVAGGGFGEMELARYPVGDRLRLASGATQAVPFQVPTPKWVPFNVVYGQQLPGFTVGVRTEVAVSGGSGKTDFDPVGVEAGQLHQHIMDALGTIGCRFVRNEVRPGVASGLQVPAAQAITFYAPLPQGEPAGPHVPQLTFSFAEDEDGLDVVAELAARPGQGEHHRVSSADAQRLAADEEGWVIEVDGWVTSLMSKPAAAQAGSGAFLQPTPQPMPHGGHRPQHQQQYAYGGRPGQHNYAYGGYRRGSGMGMGGAVAAGVGGAALGFLGGMMIGGMINDAMTPDAAPEMTDAAATEDYAGGDYGGGDYGGDFGGDFGGGDFGGGEF
ncbi:MAG TPA: sporulation protein [Candidatus Limnocylindrales bacterium]